MITMTTTTRAPSLAAAATATTTTMAPVQIGHQWMLARYQDAPQSDHFYSCTRTVPRALFKSSLRSNSGAVAEASPPCVPTKTRQLYQVCQLDEFQQNNEPPERTNVPSLHACTAAPAHISTPLR